MALYDKEVEKNLNSIVELKKGWQQADYDKNIEAKQKMQNDAKQYYNNLISLGRSDIADKLQNSNYEQAAQYQNTMQKNGKTEFRPYMYSLGKKAGLSNSEMDALISWDNDTKEITFAGKKIGSPDAIVDGKSYFSDTSALDNAFNDYQQRTGNINTYNLINNDEAYISDKRRQDYDYNLKNPFETDWGKEMMSGVSGDMKNAGDSALASGASTNSGNIDSFAAANAARQKEAVLNSRRQAVWAAQQQILNNAESILNNIGLDNTRRTANYEARLNGETERLVNQSEVTGYVPEKWAIQNDSFLKNFVDENGKLKSEYTDTDFQELINNAKENGNTELANKYAILRGMKILGNDAYLKYLNEGDIAFLEPQHTANYELTEKGYETEKSIANTEAAASKYAADKQYDASKLQTDASERMNANTNNTNYGIALLDSQTQKDVASGKALQDYQDEMAKQSLSTINAYISAFNKENKGEAGKDIIFYDSNGNYWFNPSMSSSERNEYEKRLKEYLNNIPQADNDLKNMLYDELLIGGD